MTYKDVLFTTAITIAGLICSAAQAQDTAKTLEASIGSKGEIISGSDWIAKVSRDNDAYLVEFKSRINETRHCEVSITKEAAAKAAKSKGLETMLNYPSERKLEVEIFYVDPETDDDVAAVAPFKIACSLS